MKQAYEIIKKQLEKVRFEEIWPGFHQEPFALYDETSACIDGKIIPKPENFKGNTATEYEGRGIAIWKMSSEEYKSPPERMAANLVHEMFHVYQAECNEQRYPNDLMMLRYPDNTENFTFKHQENQLLAAAYRQKDCEKAKNLLSQFCDLRKYRNELIGVFTEIEGKVETLEGLAEYAGMCALKMLAPQSAEMRIEEYLNLLENLSPLLFDVRRISYFVGTVLALTAKNAGISAEHLLGQESRSLYQIITDKLSSASAVVTPTAKDKEDVKTMLSLQIAEKEKRISDFFAATRTRVQGEYIICGYDPMNMISMEDKVLGTHFFMLYDEKAKQMITLEKECLLQVKEGTPNRITAYWT